MSRTGATFSSARESVRTVPLAAGLRDGRVLLLGLVGCYFLALLLLALDEGLVLAWRRFGVFALEPSFADLRSITSAWECTREGIDVLPVNPCDPWQRPANYPSLWTTPAFTGLGQESTVYLGVATAITFFASVILLIGRPSLRSALVYAVLLCSPAVMLGVERGNADLLLFALVVLGVAILRRRRVVAHALLLLAAVLKLFPVFAWGVLLRQPRRWVLAGGGTVLVVFASYALVTLDEIRAIRAAVPQEVQSSYGAAVGVEAAQDLIARLELTPLYSLTNPSAEPLGQAAVVVAGLLLGLWLARRWRARSGAVSEPELDAFWAGAGIYCGSFALFQNYDYRLVFLLLVAPQLLRWAREPEPLVPLAGCALGGLVAALWLGTTTGFGELWADAARWFPFEEIVNWLLFAYLAAALILTRPGRSMREADLESVTAQT